MVEVENNKVKTRQYELFNAETDSDLAQLLTDLEINTLICGAISKRFSDIIEINNIKLIPFITGHVDVVLESYITNYNIGTDFFMPGCRNKHYRQRNGGNNLFNTKAKEVNMPRTDGTGPQGQGAGTGRNQGPCQGQGQGKGQSQGGRGQGQGRGCGTGQGKGQGRGQGGGQGSGQGRQ